jgi:predicted secreted protein
MNRIAFLAAGCLAAAAHAGVYVELVDRDIAAKTTTPAQKMYVQGGAGRFVDNEGHTSIIKGDTMYIVDDDDKSYIVFDKATMEQLAQQLNSAMAKMKDQLAKLPPEQRAQIESQMGSMMGMGGGEKKWTVEAVDTGKSDKVDGRTCRIWDVKRNGELDDQICVVPYSALPGKENFQKVFANFAKVFEEMAKSVPMLAGMMSNEFDAQTKVNGFPVRSRGYENGKLGNEEQVVTVWREEAIPAAMFEIPAGYKKKAMPMGAGGQ